MMPKKCSVCVRPIAGETVPSIFLGPNPVLGNFYLKISKVKKKLIFSLYLLYFLSSKKKEKFLKL